jgi:hypothetical protein
MAKLGRRKGRRNKGYVYRKGRGWGTSIDQRFIPLTHPDRSFNASVGLTAGGVGAGLETAVISG